MAGQLRPGRVALLYALFGAVWIVVSDQLVLRATTGLNREVLAQTSKGLLYVVVTAFLVHWLVAREMRISERARAWYQELFSIVPDAIFVVGQDGRFVEVNQVAVERYGYTREELCQMGPHDLAPPDRQPQVPVLLAAARQEERRLEWQHRTKDGCIVDVDIVSRPVQLEGRPCVLSAVRDISAIKRAESALRHTEELQRAIVEASPVALFSIDLDGRVLTWNHSAERIFGWTAEEVVGQPLPIVPDGNHEEYRELRLRAATTGLSQVELVRRRKDGSSLDVQLSAAPLRDPDGEVCGILAAMEDITARREVEEQLRHREELLSEMGRLAKIGGWEFDPATGQGSWTDEVARIHGLDPGTAASASLGLSFYRGEHRRRIEEALRSATEQAQPYNLELELVTAQGDTRWVQTIGHPTVVDGQVVQVRGSFQDITDRKLAEERIEHLNRLLRAVRDISQLIARERSREALVQQACDLLVEHRSLAGALVVLTDAAGQVATVAEATAGADFGPLHAVLEAGRFPDCMQQAADGDTSWHAVDEQCTCATVKGSPERLNTLSIRLGRKSNGYGSLVLAFEPEPPLEEAEHELLVELAEDLSSALSAIADREARAQAERDRDALQRQLLQASKMEAVGQLAGGVAHDFNNILQAIMGYASLLIDEPGMSANDREAVAEIRKGAERAATLTRQLLAFSRRQVMRPALLDPNQIVENLLKMLRRLIGEHIHLTWSPGAEVGAIRADAGMIEQVIVNLCVNARDAMPNGGRLTLSTSSVSLDTEYCTVHPWAKAGQYALLEVTDNGTGMDRATLDRIFEPFFTTKGEAQGTGLGLATVYGIVKQHEGMISAYSEPGRGSSFRVYLPLVGQSADPVDALEQPAPSGGSETVLLAEDDEMVQRLASTILQRAGYRVLCASDGEEAVQLFEAHRDGVDIAVLDVVMPKLSGPEVYSRLRAMAPALPVLFSSGYSDAAVHTNFVLNEGMTLLQKPYAPAALLRHVRAMLDRHK